MKRLKMKNIFLCLLVSLYLSGCASLSKDSDSNDLARIWLEQTLAMTIEEVYGGDHELYLKYRVFEESTNRSRVFYGYATWDSDKDASIDLSKNLVVPIIFMEEAQWRTAVKDLRPVQSLNEQYWLDFWLKLAHQITPQDSGFGTVIRNDEEELFFYYNDNDQLKVVDIKDKPADVRIQESLSQEQLSGVIVDVFSQYLGSINKMADSVLLTMSQKEDFSHPFLYVDLKHKMALNLKVPSSRENRYKDSFIKKGIKSADHVIIDSHVLGLVTRPISSSFRLYSWTKNTTYDLARPRVLRYFESESIPPLYDGSPMDLKQWEEKLNKIVKNTPSSGTMKFLIGGDQFFPRLIETMIDAQESIDMRIFIFDNDDYAVKIADIMKSKSKERGVDVKVLLDGFGVLMGEGHIPESLPADFVPPSSMKKYLKRDSNIKVRVRPNTWFKADHIKTIVMDNRICFTGGMNIGREYRYDWHDMMVEVQGPVVADIIHDFNLTWAHTSRYGDLGYLGSRIKTKKPVIEGDGYPIRLLYTKVNDQQIFKAQIAAIKESKRYIYIHNAYFSDNAILYELIKARRRGVDVRVVLPVNGNHEIMNASNIVTANKMFKNGIRVYFYPGMSHIKAAIYDGWLCTGSANFDKLSFKDNLEMNLATSHPEIVQELQQILFETDFTKSLEMIEPLQSGLKQRIAEFLAEQL